MASSAPQMNGLPPSSSNPSGSQTVNNTQITGQTPSSQQTTQPFSQQLPVAAANNPATNQQQQQQQQQQPSSTPRPRDARTLELLLTAQGVTAYEPRVPLLLLDFAYRHTSSVLSDALHLSADPYTSHAGAKPSATSGAAPVNVGDAVVSANAVQLAIATRLAYQFRAGGGGASKEWMMELARERNKVALPRVTPSEWGVRLPNERFVLSGVSWGLKDVWTGMADEEGSEEAEDEDEEGMEDVQMGGTANEEDIGGDGVEGGTMGDVFGDDVEEEDQEMAEE